MSPANSETDAHNTFLLCGDRHPPPKRRCKKRDGISISNIAVFNPLPCSARRLIASALTFFVLFLYGLGDFFHRGTRIWYPQSFYPFHAYKYNTNTCTNRNQKVDQRTFIMNYLTVLIVQWNQSSRDRNDGLPKQNARFVGSVVSAIREGMKTRTNEELLSSKLPKQSRLGKQGSVEI